MPASLWPGRAKLTNEPIIVTPQMTANHRRATTGTDNREISCSPFYRQTSTLKPLLGRMMFASVRTLGDVRNQGAKILTNRIPLRTIHPPEKAPHSKKSKCIDDVKAAPVLCRDGSTIVAIKQRLLAQGMTIDPPLSFRSRKTRCIALLRRKKVVRNIWSDEKVLCLFFQKLRPKEVLTCSMVCKLWRQMLIPKYTQNLQLVINFKRYKEQKVTSIEEQLRLAYQWKMTAISLVQMRDDCVCPFIGAYYTTFKEFFPGCPIASPEITNDSFKSVPNLLSRSPTQHSSCADSLECGNLRRLGSAPIEVPMKAARHITQLTVDNCCLGDVALEQILNVMHTVTNLSIVSCNCLSDMALWSCLRPWMTHITVRDCLNFKDDALQAIVQSTPGLQELNIQIYHLSDTAMGTFMSRRHFNLRVLRLAYGSDLTLLGMSNLVGSLPGLQELRLTGCSRINDAAVDLICEHMPYLQVMEISANPIITDAALATIGESLEQLEQLSLDRQEANHIFAVPMY
ncbi:F-box/LRR-repeat protein 16 [Taenia solium]|eukprot:TsM_001141200 transcript=TsM_001141200 gene=TsM_001141200